MVETQNLSKGATIPQEGAGLGSEQNTTSPQEGATIPQEGATIPQEGAAGTRAYRARQDGTEQKRTEGNGIGRNGTESAGAGATTGIFAPSARFTDWWQLWSGTKGTSSRVKAEAAYRQHVPAVAELDCFECTASYLQSLDDPNRGFNPQNFLNEQAQDKFRARWPASTNGKRAEGQSLVERTLALMQSRIDKGQPPL